MKTLSYEKYLCASFGFVYALSTVSKWSLNLPVRLPIFFIPALIWLVACVVYFNKTAVKMRAPLLGVIISKLAFFLLLILYLPVAYYANIKGAVTTHFNGILYHGLSVMTLCALLLLAGSASRSSQKILIQSFIFGTLSCAAYTYAQGISSYVYGFNLDTLASQLIPFSAESIDDGLGDAWSWDGNLFYRLDGVTADPSLNASIMILSIPIVLSTYRRQTITALIIILLNCFVIVQSLSVTAMFTLAIMATYYLMMGANGGRKIFAIVLALCAVIIFATWQHFGTYAILFLAGRLGEGGTQIAHAGIIDRALLVWRESPLGNGINTFALISSDYSTHNTYIQRLVEMGVIGFALLLINGIIQLYIGISNRSRGGSDLMLLAVASFIVASGHDIGSRFEIEAPSILMIGIICNGSSMYRRELSFNPENGRQ